MLGGDVGRKRREVWSQPLDLGKTKDQELAAKLRAANDEGDPCRRGSRRLLDAFFTKERRRRPARRREGPHLDERACAKDSRLSRTTSHR